MVFGDPVGCLQGTFLISCSDFETWSIWRDWWWNPRFSGCDKFHVAEVYLLNTSKHIRALDFVEHGQVWTLASFPSDLRANLSLSPMDHLNVQLKVVEFRYLTLLSAECIPLLSAECVHFFIQRGSPWEGFIDLQSPSCCYLNQGKWWKLQMLFITPGTVDVPFWSFLLFHEWN